MTNFGWDSLNGENSCGSVLGTMLGSRYIEQNLK